MCAFHDHMQNLVKNRFKNVLRLVTITPTVHLSTPSKAHPKEVDLLKKIYLTPMSNPNSDDITIVGYVHGFGNF